ncbi:methionine--tRNA ligase [Candidatus Nephthysia bennettiae]|uniref:Methionine--tRNA ligase n=1 Tax=Candidatus Nephthysia bennettiae TaxID=3127016 RepID=A0A934KC79_9BACT|nr:methionine--tRNA ligase [Candidatus Dormibacteraeota bacterium]MBJ7611190.1 methionine--tRNA ligase [Candidatus Dormibacteraeota bacterium]
MPDSEKVLVCVAWPYANGPRHIGHLAGYGVPSDVFARFHRLRGNRVLMVSGTDEHGTPITYGADREGIPPGEFADRNNAVIVEDQLKLGLSYDTFTRTTTGNHYRVVQDVFKTLYDKGYIVERTQMGAISPSTGRTLPDRYIQGTCPICGYPEARGDQCDNCGNQLDPADLINPRSRINGEVPVFRETEQLFFELPAFAEQLREWIERQTHWRPNVRSYSLNFISDLKPRAITRDLDWGVPVPLPGWADRPDKRIYVWFDAVIGYLSASIEWAVNRGTPEAWREWWEDGSARHYYFMGKDNITFHTVMWPSILLGVGGLDMPYDIVASEFLTMEGKQFSTSRGHVILVRDVLSRYDPDALRYYLIAAGPETQDSDFTWFEFVRRNNDELVGTWGNLVHRTLVNAHRNFGAVPEPGGLTERDRRLLADVETGFETVAALLGGTRFKAALQEVMRLAGLVNQYLGEEQPWHLIKQDRARAATTLFVALRAVDSLKVVMTPFLPFSSQRLHEMLGYGDLIAPQAELREYVEEGGRSHQVQGNEYDISPRWSPSALPVGRPLPAPRPLFKKIDAEVVEEELRRMAGD